jgi:mRNA interferase MazF
MEDILESHPKDYIDWSRVKAKIHNSANHPIGYKEREIRLCNLGENIGFEEDGKGVRYMRPVLIIKIFNRELCHVIPLSTTENDGRYFYHFDSHTGKESVALLSQSRTIDSSRLSRQIGYIESDDFKKIKQKLARVLKLS